MFMDMFICVLVCLLVYLVFAPGVVRKVYVIESTQSILLYMFKTLLHFAFEKHSVVEVFIL